MGRGVTDERTPRRRWVERLPLAVALSQAALVLGPTLRPGVAIRYDMAWSPDPRWTPFVLGLDTPAPRAVPSDAAAVLLGHLVGGGLAQKIILVGILVALGVGAAGLVRELDPLAGPAARTVATVAAVWNPFVYERLMVGQWTVLAGLALVPWGLRQVLRAARGKHSAAGLALLVAVAGLGGANTLVIVLAAAVPALLVVMLIRRDRASSLALAVTGGVGLGIAAAWVLPAILGGARSDAAGALAFVPVADSPLGVVGSLASGGGFWNAAVHPDARQNVVISGAAAVLTVVGVLVTLAAARTRARWPLVVSVMAPTLVVLLSVMPPLEPGWRWLVTSVPGGGLLRDSHKLIAPWVLVGAVGLGLLVPVIRRRVQPALAGPVVVLLVLVPVALTPFLAWGGFGQLSSVRVPTEYRAALKTLNSASPGDVGLLPWSQYRRYDWNDNRISLTLAPRMVSRVVLFDDSLPLRRGVIPGESPRAAEVSAAIAQGRSPVQALAASGVRYILLERTAAGESLIDEARAAGSTVTDGTHALVVDLRSPSSALQETDATPTIVGWLITVATLGGVMLTLLARRARAPKD